MNPISTSSMYQSALLNIMNAQQQEQAATAQAGSGKVGNDLESYGSGAGNLTATMTLQSRITGYVTNGQALSGRLDEQNTALQQVATASQSAESAVREAIGAGDASSLINNLQSQMSLAVSALNTQSNGQYLFAGGNSGAAPVAAAQLSDLTAASSVAAVFTNDQNPTKTRLDDNTVTTTGFLASHIGSSLMQALKDVQSLNAGPNGPLTGTLTAAQSTALGALLGEFTTATTTANGVVDQNGAVQNQLSDSQTALQDQQSALQGVISKITDFDMGQVATNLTLAQTALQASASVFSSLQNDSLLNLLSSSS